MKNSQVMPVVIAVQDSRASCGKPTRLGYMADTAGQGRQVVVLEFQSYPSA